MDKVFDASFSFQAQPGTVTAASPEVFQQLSSNKKAETWEDFKGVGLWEERAEEQDVPEGNPRVDNQKTFTNLNFSKAVDISKNFFDDDQHEVVNMMIKDFATKARATQDNSAFGIFRNHTGTTLTSDGIALISASHTNLNGATVSNIISGALSVSTMESAIVKLSEQVGQDNVILGNIPKTLLVPRQLWKEAVEITESKLLANTTDNNLNWISAKFGVNVATSSYLGAAAGNNGTDTAWWVLSDNHSVLRFVRQGVVTRLIDWSFQRNNNYIYKGEFREIYGVMTYEGIVGSTGA